MREIRAGGDHLESTASLKQGEWVGPIGREMGETPTSRGQGAEGEAAQVKKKVRAPEQGELFLDGRKAQRKSVLESVSQWQWAVEGREGSGDDSSLEKCGMK